MADLPVKRKKVGLALGGGAARGLAHIGVLELMEKEGIPIDYIAGTSAGALIGSLYAQGKSAREIKEVAIEMSAVEKALLWDPSIELSGIFAGKRITKLLESIIGKARFEDLQIPFSCVAVDIITGEEVILKEGSVVEAVRASISVPIVFTVVKKDGRYLVDGGLLNPVPVDVARKMGADFVIAVNVLPLIGKKNSIHRSKKGKKEDKPGIFHVALNTIEIANSHFVEETLKTADFVIEPDTTKINPADFWTAEETILQGEFAASDALPTLKRKLKEQGIL